MTPSDHAKPRIGLFSIGLDAYWPQFAGLRERLLKYTDEVAERLKEDGAELINFGLVDSPVAAMQTGHAMRAADVDIVFLYVTTYALSSTVLPVLRLAKVPVIVLSVRRRERSNLSIQRSWIFQSGTGLR